MKSGTIKPRFYPRRQILKRPIIGDMRHLITISIRTIQPTTLANVDFDETFTVTQNVYAAIETKKGVNIFDGTNVTEIVDTIFTIRFIGGLVPFYSGITDEKWIDYEGERFDIKSVESIDNRRIFLRLTANTRGDSTLPVNKS